VVLLFLSFKVAWTAVVEGGAMNEYYSYCPECGESLIYSYCRCVKKTLRTVDVTENWGKLIADLDCIRKELEALQEKVRNITMSEHYPEFIKAWAELRNAVEACPENVITESVTQPHIDFCYACGTALGCD